MGVKFIFITNVATNIKRCRVATDKETLTTYIENFKDVVRGIPLDNIWNSDETNLSDDPGQKKVIATARRKIPRTYK